jgi:hypothetical protein
LDSLFIAAESVKIANLVAGAFCSIPLAVSSIPMAFPAINPKEGGWL